MSNVVYRLQGDKVGLRGLTKEDANGVYFDWLQMPEIIEILESQKFPTSRANLETYIESNNNIGIEALFGICNLENDQLVGTIRLSNFNWVSRTAAVGILIGNPNIRGQGFGKQSLKLIIQYAFETLNIRKVYAGVASNNPASLGLFRSEMVEEGIRRDHIFSDGQLHDEHMFAIFKE